MTKKLIKQGENLVLILDKPVQEILGINENTQLDLVVMGDVLLIKPQKIDQKRHAELEKTATAIMDKYESVFKKLAKT